MKIQLLIAVADRDYTEHLSGVFLEKYGNIFVVTTCSDAEQLDLLTCEQRFDVLLVDYRLKDAANLVRVKLPLLLWEDQCGSVPGIESMASVRKYQRISSIVNQIMERYTELCGRREPEGVRAHITAVWSPAGGCGKTTVALAYLEQKIMERKKGVYLNLEPFSSSPVYFTNNGKSISSVFEKLDSNVELLLQSIRQEDHGSGICYFCRPDNYDDMSILQQEEIIMLLKSAANGVDELVVDLGSGYDIKVKTVLEFADTVLLVSDSLRHSQVKLEQFCTQHDLYEMIAPKSRLVLNKGARKNNAMGLETVLLPVVQSEDPVVVYKTLSAGYFKG